MTEHDGPCVNYEGQEPEDYDGYDSCARHLVASRRRQRWHRYAAVCYMITGALWLSFSWCVVEGWPLQAIACLLLALAMSGLADRLTR